MNGPKVELETLVMTIPSAQKNIDIVGKVNAKKQLTLNGFFGLKGPKSVNSAAISEKAKEMSITSGRFDNKKRGRWQNSNDNNEASEGSSEPKQRICPFYKVSDIDNFFDNFWGCFGQSYVIKSPP